jgi:hypothetical protein
MKLAGRGVNFGKGDLALVAKGSPNVLAKVPEFMNQLGSWSI